MINLRACVRCGGDMMIEQLLGETELVCIQCGHRSAMETPSPYLRPRRQTPARKAA